MTIPPTQLNSGLRIPLREPGLVLPPWLADKRLDVVIDWGTRWMPAPQAFDVLDGGECAAWELTWWERAAPPWHGRAPVEDPEPFFDEGPLSVLRDRLVELLDGSSYELDPDRQVQLVLCGWAAVFGRWA